MIKWLTIYTLKIADVVITDAEHMKDDLISLGAAPEKIVHVNFGVDVLKFKPGSPNEEIKRQLNILGSPVVISLRTLEPL
ncbi:hypothetical protein DRN86_00175, partial [Candidatus Geothermarchaeota archaeon]